MSTSWRTSWCLPRFLHDLSRAVFIIDRDPFMSQSIDDEALTRLQEICRRFGLNITRAVQQGVMLTITPTSLDHLPDAAVLRELADALGGDGVRYVTLDLSEEPIND